LDDCLTTALLIIHKYAIFAKAPIWGLEIDSYGTEAIVKHGRYAESGKKLTLRHLSDDCKAVLRQAKANITQEEDDPEYKVARDY